MNDKIPPAHHFPFSFFKGVILPIFLWIAFTPWSAALDLKTTHAFYDSGIFVSHPFLDWLYAYGLYPAWILMGLAFLGFLVSFFKSYYSWRTPCLYLLLTFAIGGGIVINGILKDHWGRPRPKQSIEFGGKQPFRAYYEPNLGKQPEPSKSFSSGHASSGFYFFALAILGAIYQSRLLYWIGFSLAWGLGILLSVARIAQGGHFLSDTLASALIMWLTAWGLAYYFFAVKERHKKRILG